MKIYIVIIENRHTDTEAKPFSTSVKAIEYANKSAVEFCRHTEDYEEGLDDGMKKEGWIWYAKYSCEGDNVRVIERDIDGA